jgi:hypothetical protein
VDRFQLHIDKALTNVSVQFRNADFVAADIFPEVPVNDQSDKYFVYGKENLKAYEDLVEARVSTNEVQMSRSANSYYCNGHGLRSAIGDEDRGNDDLGSLEIDATTNLTENILLNREIGLLNVLKAGLTPVDLSASAWANAFDTATADPITFLDIQKEVIQKQIGKKPNTLMLSRPVFRGLRNNPKVTGRISGATSLDGSLVTAKQLAAVLEIDNLLVGEAVLNSAPEGEADSINYVWGKYALLCYKPPNPGLRTVSLGYHYMWNFPIGGGGRVSAATSGQSGVGVRRWYEEGPRTTFIEVLRYYDQNMVAAGAGILFSNATQF